MIAHYHTTRIILKFVCLHQPRLFPWVSVCVHDKAAKRIKSPATSFLLLSRIPLKESKWKTDSTCPPQSILYIFQQKIPSTVLLTGSFPDLTMSFEHTCLVHCQTTAFFENLFFSYQSFTINSFRYSVQEIGAMSKPRFCHNSYSSFESWWTLHLSIVIAIASKPLCHLCLTRPSIYNWQLAWFYMHHLYPTFVVRIDRNPITENASRTLKNSSFQLLDNNFSDNIHV